MEALSNRYGWTPDQIRAMRSDDVDDYLTIIGLKHDIEKAEQMKKSGV